MYLNPNNSRPKMNVYIAPQRNHQNARSSSFGFTFGFSSLSRSAWNGTFTRLKKYRCPSHTMPNMMWAKRIRTLVRDGMSSNMGALYTQSTRRSTASGPAFDREVNRVSVGRLCRPELVAGGFGNPPRVPITIFGCGGAAW